MAREQIELLTKDQEAQLAVYREKWLRVGLSTDPADRKRAEAGVIRAYEIAGLRAPKIFVWLQSPLAGAVAAAMIKHFVAAFANKVGDYPFSSAQVGDQVRAQVGAQVWDQVRAQVGAQVWDQVRAQVWDQVGACGFGQHDANWVGWVNFFDSVVGLQVCKKLEGLREITESSGWWWPFDGLCILTERPSRLFRDDRNRLHCADGLAIGYPDGWSIYAWHGVRVPEDVILHPEKITADQIEKEANAEVRRVMVERVGYERYILESGAKLIHSDKTGALYRKEFENDEPLVVVHVLNSTPESDGSIKRYALRVPPTIKRAREAIAWTFDVPESEYRPLVET